MPVPRPLLPNGLLPRIRFLRTASAACALLGFGSVATPTSAAGSPALSVTFRQLAASPLIAPAGSGTEAWLKQLPQTIQAAEGKSIEITGYVLPLKIEKGRAREFLLMRDQSGCCYGKMPAANEYLVASAPAGSGGVPAIMDIPVTVRGTLRIAPASFDGVLTQFYTLENASSAPP